jgi:hypothetical protein
VSRTPVTKGLILPILAKPKPVCRALGVGLLIRRGWSAGCLMRTLFMSTLMLGAAEVGDRIPTPAASSHRFALLCS